MLKTVLFQTIQFSISTQFCSFWSIDRALSGATTLGQSGPGSDGSAGMLHIPQNSSITGTSPSDCFVLYPGHSLGVSYPSVNVQSVYSTAQLTEQYTELNVKTILFQKIQFSISMQIKFQNSSILNNSV